MSAEGVLSIAGLDPSGGAGLLADIKVFHQMNVTGFGVTTAVTYQNESELIGLKWLNWEEIKSQLDALFRAYTITTAKIGIVENFDVLDKIITYLKSKSKKMFIVWDPIFSSSSGYEFHQSIIPNQLLKTLTKLDLFTPNIPEMEKVLELLEFESFNQLIPITNFILKGGHGEGDVIEDSLYLQNGECITIRQVRLKALDKRGTGCTFSSVIAASQFLEHSMEKSFHLANDYVQKLLKSSEEKLGLHHLVNIKIS